MRMLMGVVAMIGLPVLFIGATMHYIGRSAQTMTGTPPYQSVDHTANSSSWSATVVPTQGIGVAPSGQVYSTGDIKVEPLRKFSE